MHISLSLSFVSVCRAAHIHSQGKCTDSPCTCGHLSARRIYIETVHCKPNNDRVAKCEVQGRRDAGREERRRGTPGRRVQYVAERGTKVGISLRQRQRENAAPHTARTFYLPLFPRACTINLTYHFPRASDRLLYISDVLPNAFDLFTSDFI